LSGRNRPPKTSRTSNPNQPSTGFDGYGNSNSGASSTNYSSSSNYSPFDNNKSQPLLEKY